MHDAFSDETLMRQVQDGKLRQTGPLFERYQGSLYSFFVHTTRDRVASEDLVQDVFFRVIKYRSSYRHGKAFKPWLYQIARNVLNDHHSTRTPEFLPVESIHVEEQNEPHRSEASHEQLYTALESLPKDQYELLILSNVTDLSYKEIAQLYGISVNTARVRVFRALRTLRSVYLYLNPSEK